MQPLGPIAVVTVNDNGGQIRIKGIPYATIAPSADIYQAINQHLHDIVAHYRAPLVVIAHSSEGRHTLIYTTDRTIEEVSSKELTRMGINPEEYPPFTIPTPKGKMPVEPETPDEHEAPPVATVTFLKFPEPLNIDTEPTGTSRENTPTGTVTALPHAPMEPKTPLTSTASKAPRTSKRAIAALTAALILVATGTATAILTLQHSKQEAPQPVAPPPITRPSHSENQSTTPQTPPPPPAPETPTQTSPPPPPVANTQEQTETPGTELPIEGESEPPTDAPTPVPTAPPPSPNPVPEPDYGLTDLQTSLLTGGGGIVHVTFYLSGHGNTQATITIAGRSATVTGTAPGSVGATVTGVPVGTHAWTSTADGLVNSGTVTVY